MNGILSVVFCNWFLYGCIILWVLFQFVLVYFGAYDELISDPGFYVYYATECVKNGTMYPDYTNYHDEYIFNPGYVNFLIVWIRLFGSVKFIPYFNIVLNIVIVWLIYIIGKQIANKKIAYVAVYCFMLIPSYTTIVLHLYTEQLFVVLILLSLLPFIYRERKQFSFFLSGGVIAFAQWVRPLSIAWMAPCVLLLLCKKEWKKCTAYVVAYAITCIVIAVATHQNFPDYLYKAKTGGVNMIMGANDFADGTYCGDARRDKNGLGYLPDVIDESRVTNVKLWVGDSTYAKRRNAKYTYNQYDSIYVNRSILWIKSNPIKWFKVSLRKIYCTFCDVPSFFYSYGGELTIPNKVYSRVYGKSKYVFFVIIFASVLSMLIYISKPVYLFLFSVPLICYLFSIFVTCGIPRYSMPFIPFFCILTSKFLYDVMVFVRNHLLKKSQ